MTIREEYWSVWRGPECEGDKQGQQRLFVHRMPLDMAWDERLRIIRDAMHEHDITEVYFCREHIEDHGPELPISVAQFDKAKRVYVCVDPAWPPFIAFELSTLPKDKLHVIIEVNVEGLFPFAGYNKEIKLLWADFNVSCTSVDRMPHASGYCYSTDVCVLQDPFGVGQLRRFRDSKTID